MGSVRPGRTSRASGSATATARRPAGAQASAGAEPRPDAATPPPRQGPHELLAALGTAPRALAGAVVLIAAQGLLLAGLGILQIVRGFGHHIDNLARAEAGGVISLLGALMVLALARRLVVDSEASRSPVVVIELLCLPVGWALCGNGLYGYGIPLLVVAVAILALLATASLRSRGASDQSD